MSLEALRGRLAMRRNDLRNLRVAVLAGGESSEREVSLTSGKAVAHGLIEAGFSAYLLSIGKDGRSIDQVLGGPELRELPGSHAATLRAQLGPERAAEALRAWGPGILLQEITQLGTVFTTLHGAAGENGVWQGFLELIGVPYVSAGVKGSALAMDKLTAKRLFESLRIPTPRYWVVHEPARDRARVPPEVRELVAKPVDQGSSVGIAIVANDDAGWAEIAALALRFTPLLVEERVYGRELTAGFIGHSFEPVRLPLVEIRPRRGFYDYQAKYTAGQSEYICPAEIEADVAAGIQDLAETVYRELDLGPYSRIDCLLDADNRPWFLEANTLPGFTSLSLLPRAAQAAGIEFGELLELLLLCALERWEGYGRGGHEK